MKAFVIRNDEDHGRRDLAYMVYYEKSKRFYIELPDDADEWETPLLLSSCLKKGEKTVSAYWSNLWVRQRIVPMDRQNLGQVLKENNLSEYDEFKLLMLANGRCAQDNFYLVHIDEALIAKKFPDRYEKRVEDVIPLKEKKLLVFFRDGCVKKSDVAAIVGDNRFFKPILAAADIFQKVYIQPGGYGIGWGERTEISDKILYENGIDIPLSKDDFVSFISNRVVDSAEAASIMQCSRQNINELTKRGQLHPVKAALKNTLFLKGDILRRMWK